jgi:hypothetical protein
VILLHAAKGKFAFRISESEKSLLFTLFELYPRVPSAASLSARKGKSRQPKETEALLEEALAEQRAETRKQLKGFLADGKRFEQTEKGWKFTLTDVEAEWLLQVLNDIRVGSWVALGSPEERLDVLNESNMRDFWAMEISGRFEMILLEALRGSSLNG